jgi:hypothetical protein
MKNSNLTSKIAALLGVLAVLFSLTLMYSLNDPTDPTGPISRVLGNYIHTPTTIAVESTMQVVGTFDINEKNIQKLLTILIVLSSLVSGILAVIASRNERSSLWYSLAIVLSSAALMKLNTLVAIAFLFIIGFICIRNRKWKMTHY